MTFDILYEAIALLELRFRGKDYREQIRQRYNEIVAEVRFKGANATADHLITLDVRASRMIQRGNTKQLDIVAFNHNAAKLLGIPPPFFWRDKVKPKLAGLKSRKKSTTNVIRGPWLQPAGK